MSEHREKEREWFDSPNAITLIMIGLLIILIILSQSFAIQNHLSAHEILRSILNHNSIYVITLFYFILVRTKVGKRYFDYLNVIMAILYILMAIAGLFTIFQSFGLASFLSLSIRLFMMVYFLYAFIMPNEFGRELKLENSPIADINNGQYFYLITILLIVELVVVLIDSVSFDGIVVSLLEMMYQLLFARYIYLYKEYQLDKASKQNKKNTRRKKNEVSSIDETSKKNMEEEK